MKTLLGSIVVCLILLLPAFYAALKANQPTECYTESIEWYDGVHTVTLCPDGRVK